MMEVSEVIVPESSGGNLREYLDSSMAIFALLFLATLAANFEEVIRYPVPRPSFPFVNSVGCSNDLILRVMNRR
jgi:hypothetical protein